MVWCKEIGLLMQCHDFKMIHDWQNFNNAIFNFISIPSFRFHMQYLLCCVVCFRVRGTTREMFVVDVMEVTLANREIFTQWHAHDAKVTLV
jgi:hypothetical protein